MPILATLRQRAAWALLFLSSASGGTRSGPEAGSVSGFPWPLLTLPLHEYVTVFDAAGAGASGKQMHVTEYYGRVGMGDPPQFFDVVFDTGSGNIVLPTVKCADEACQRHRRFVSWQSRTAVQLAQEDGTPVGPEQTRDTTTITYGTGRLTGEYIRDSLCVSPNPTSGEPHACTMVDFLGVTQESRFPFSELPFDGIFGLALSGLSAGPNFNFVTRLKANSTIRDPIFAVFLRGMHADEDSDITFGGYREERLAEGEQGLSWLPMPREAEAKGYWIVTMRDIYVRGQPLGLCSGADEHPRCQVALDTGTSFMMGPRNQVAQLLESIGACAGGGQALPPLRLELDAAAGTTFDVVLGPEDYSERAGGEECALNIMPIELPPNLGSMWVLGQSVLRKYYSVYDIKRWRVGLGLARHSVAERTTLVPDLVPASAQEEGSPEVCQDDDNKMVWNHYPGCRAFADMGYCERFPPLAHQYCRLSCGLCSPRPPRAVGAGGEEAAAQTARQLPMLDDNADDVTGSGARVAVGGGFGVSRERRNVVIRRLEPSSSSDLPDAFSR